MEKALRVLKKLCLTPGISGNETYSGITPEIFNLIKSVNSNTIVDAYGNVIAVLGDGKKKVLIDAHLDEVGFLVSKNDDEKVKLVPIGNVNIQKIDKAKAYVLHKNINGRIIQETSGIIFETDIFEDNSFIQVGDIISFARAFSVVGNVVKATALDNRIGCACLVDLIDLLKGTKDVQIIAVFSAGEEKDRSILDKIATEYDVDFGIIIDAAYANPVSFGTDNMSIPDMGKGCAIQYLGMNFVIDKLIIDKITTKAKENNISLQNEIPLPDLGRTNFSKFQLSGRPGCVINVPVKNQHEQVSEVDMRDYNSAVTLVLNIIQLIKDGDL